MSTKATPATSMGTSEVIKKLMSNHQGGFALLRRWDPDSASPGPVEILIGCVKEVDQIRDIPLPNKAPISGTVHDALALVPFRQIKERGFDYQDDASPLLVLEITESYVLPVDEVLGALPDETARITSGGFNISDDDYGAMVSRILRDEIAAGEGANFVIRRDFTAVLDGYSLSTALGLYGRLLKEERGAYWTFLVHTTASGAGQQDRTLLGASPEAHIRLSGGVAIMNPISGTYRYPAGGPDLESLVEFLSDPKEVSELSMVLDEELKMMSAIGDQGGEVKGPFLREMSNVAHTEYEIRGHTSSDARDILRETMFAATVTGSPLENACRIITKYENSGRGYYSGALALFSRDAAKGQQLDSPILIRTAEITGEGSVRIGVGATLVKDSSPESETAETWAKAAGILGALGFDVPGINTARYSAGNDQPTSLGQHPQVRRLLMERRKSLAPFWLDAQHHISSPSPDTHIIDTGDTFTAMLARVLGAAGLSVQITRFDDPGLGRLLEEASGLIVLGPGPGDPRDIKNPRMNRLAAIATRLVHRASDQGLPMLGVCLGHQLVAQLLGFRLHRKAHPNQGSQRKIDFFGTSRTVGFYNSFTALGEDSKRHSPKTTSIEVAESRHTNEVNALRTDNVFGIQFHPESALTLDGPAIIADVIAYLGIEIKARD